MVIYISREENDHKGNERKERQIQGGLVELYDPSVYESEEGLMMDDGQIQVQYPNLMLTKPSHS